MAKIAYILLCHKDPDAIIAQANQLTATGDFIAIHFDARAKAADYKAIRTALADNPNVAFAKKRIKCGWGEWSLVRATLNAIETAVDAFPRASHFYMLSGDCMAIKTAEYIHRYLDEHDMDFVESFDYFESDWIKTGMKEERLIYRHVFNERTQSWLFYKSMEWQEKLGLTREVPADIQVQIGSQWWCLRRRTIEAILRFIRKRRDVVRFFATTWIPDETFFQTLVRHLIPETEINCRTLTFLMFSDYGMPVVLYNDHYEMLLNQDFLFARKISPDALELRERLGALYASEGVAFEISNEGRTLYKFLTQGGRIGQRFAPRFWETEASLGRERELLVITCKKWHVAKRLVEQIRNSMDLPAVDYLFHEEDCPLPDLGGAERTLLKRTRHRRALLRMLFDHWGRNRMVICLDPSAIDLVRDFIADRSRTRLLRIDCEFSDDYLVGHALRVGLIGERTSAGVIERLMPTIRNDLERETVDLLDAGLDNHWAISPDQTEEDWAEAIGAFLQVDRDKALEIARTPHLFAD
ncbi:Core-2/I-Branching enzyme [Tritonibacter multivorans]|uniref:Peptide O-xylosyltransferase n=1 Tax=Tritonibacter multivorans TaxID=928856 RepID=A0A0P1G3J3_9RHOB|nr:DUF5928 domain-containing protein [Tritonibacter multivorans]MDA7422561.1 DUF5928 domain-containing protein [Tritonibacter multivorans]CUH76371.1 Core-2/I-Branching enzyme [Tritonibacter multivorans]SFD39057.1 Core-2/I-Branching enzyme [Tritonibacter multivorans]